MRLPRPILGPGWKALRRQREDAARRVEARVRQIRGRLRMSSSRGPLLTRSFLYSLIMCASGTGNFRPAWMIHSHLEVQRFLWYGAISQRCVIGASA